MREGVCPWSEFQIWLFWHFGQDHDSVTIQPIFASLIVAISSRFMSLFEGHVACRNLTLTGPHCL